MDFVLVIQEEASVADPPGDQPERVPERRGHARRGKPAAALPNLLPHLPPAAPARPAQLHAGEFAS